MATLKDKLNPARFPGMSPKMAAIVGCILGEKFTNPALVELVVTFDQFILGRPEDSVGFDNFLGTKADLDANWTRLLDVAGLTPGERFEADEAYREALHTCDSTSCCGDEPRAGGCN